MSGERDAEHGAGPSVETLCRLCGGPVSADGAGPTTYTCRRCGRQDVARTHAESKADPAPCALGRCGRCGDALRAVALPGINGGAECPRCGLLVPGVVVRSSAIDLPPNLTQQQIRGILTTQALRLAECERRLAALERNVDD